MFEGSNSRSGAQANRCLAAITHGDGRVENYSVRLPMTGRIADALNNADQFIDAITPEGDQLFISKRDIRKINLVDVPKVNQLNSYRRATDKAAFDPYQVLRVPRDATPEVIKQAYHKLVRLYHPDRIGTYELPSELHDYVQAMLVRINLAYEQIGG